jgi:rhamnosyltransferase subunit B
VQSYRASVGLPRADNPLFEGQHAPAGVLALYSRVFGGPYPDYPPNVTITGQLRYDASYGATLSPELEAFLQAGAPPVVFTLGSSAVEVAGGFWDESLAAVQRLGVRGVVLAGTDAAPRLRAVAPSNVLVVEKAPHSQLFGRASVVVHQCGMGTIGTALAAGVPQLAVPFANDQPDNAWRLTRMGVAQTVYPTQYRGTRVAATLQSLLSDGRLARRARKVAVAVNGEDGVTNACDRIDALLDSTS